MYFVGGRSLNSSTKAEFGASGRCRIQIIGKLTKGDGSDVEINGLWALIAGNDGKAGSSQSIFFSSGPGDEMHGLFGVLTAVPEPSTLVLLAHERVAAAWTPA